LQKSVESGNLKRNKAGTRWMPVKPGGGCLDDNKIRIVWRSARQCHRLWCTKFAAARLCGAVFVSSRLPIARFVGLDHDRRTTNFLTRQSYADFVEPLTASIGVLLRKKIDLGSFDLIYAAGIYDYLQDDLFIALTRRLWEMCRSGGTLLIANLTADNPQIGYVEACMGWRFVLRNEERISLLLDAAIGDGHSAKLFRDPTGIVAFAKLEKA
jgi:hypothetical protein